MAREVDGECQVVRHKSDGWFTDKLMTRWLSGEVSTTCRVPLERERSQCCPECWTRSRCVRCPGCRCSMSVECRRTAGSGCWSSGTEMSGGSSSRQWRLVTGCDNWGSHERDRYVIRSGVQVWCRWRGGADWRLQCQTAQCRAVLIIKVGPEETLYHTTTSQAAQPAIANIYHKWKSFNLRIS